jgi:hypothetical protein
MKFRTATLLLIASAAPALAGLPIQVKMAFSPWDKGDGFYDCGYPSYQRVDPVSGFPFVPEIESGSEVGISNLTNERLFSQGKDELNKNSSAWQKGFGLTTPIMMAVIHQDDFGVEWAASIDPTSLPTPVRDGLTAPIDLGALSTTISPQTAANANRASVFLISVDPSSPDFLSLYPFTSEFGVSHFCCDNGNTVTVGIEAAAAAPFLGADPYYGPIWAPFATLVGLDAAASCDPLCSSWHSANKLAVTPLQGVPLQPNTTYALVVTNRVQDSNGSPVARSQGLIDLLACIADATCDGASPAGSKAGGWASGITPTAYNAYKAALAVLRGSDNTPGGNVTPARGTYKGGDVFASISALTVFKTADPAAGLTNLVNTAVGNPGDWFFTFSLTPDAVDFPVGTPDFSVNYLGTHPTLKSAGIFQEFCVYEAQVAVPDYLQNGDTLTFSGSSAVLSQIDTNANLYITIPREGPIPGTGFPAAILERAGAGGNVPLVNRGTELSNGNFPGYGNGLNSAGSDVADPQPGEGPALYFARAGYLGVQLDDTFGGNRRPSGKKISDEDSLIFTANDAAGIRDHVRQMAAELVGLAQNILPSLPGKTLSASNLAACTQIRCSYESDPIKNPTNDPTVGRTCVDIDSAGNPTGGTTGNTNPPAPVVASFTIPSSGMPIPLVDRNKIAVMGHSVGASTVPLAVAGGLPFGPTGQGVFSHVVMNGSGASWIENVLHKQLPALDPIPFSSGRHGFREGIGSWVSLDRKILSEGDPAILVAVWNLEPADSQIADQFINRNEPRLQGGASALGLPVPANGFVLDFQGIVDHYIQPPVANSQSLPLGLGLGITQAMVSSGHPHSFDLDPAYYPNTTANEWLDNPNVCSDPYSGGFLSAAADFGAKYCGSPFDSPYHDFRAFMPYSQVLAFGGYQTNGHFKELSLPQRGPSLVVQVDNGPNPRGDGAGGNDPPTNTAGQTKQDGHEAMWQHLPPKVKMQCFLKSAALSPTNTAIIAEDFGQGLFGRATECCAHRFDETGIALLDNCSSCSRYVCSVQPSCCTSNWDASCVAIAIPPPVSSCVGPSPCPAQTTQAACNAVSSPTCGYSGLILNIGIVGGELLPSCVYPPCIVSNCPVDYRDMASCNADGTCKWLGPLCAWSTTQEPPPAQCDPGNPDR